MGRCYEFGVSIDEACDHAMVVAPEGGACVCATCGSSCTGRFTGCAAILAKPGHVPLAAPRRLVDLPHAAGRVTVPLRPPAPEPEERSDPTPTVPTSQPILTEAIDRLDKLPALVESMGGGIDALREELRQRDDELLSVFERLAEAYDRVARELAADRAARDRLVATIGDLSARLEALEHHRDGPAYSRLPLGEG
jgi:hypothetical protein